MDTVRGIGDSQIKRRTPDMIWHPPFAESRGVLKSSDSKLDSHERVCGANPVLGGETITRITRITRKPKTW